MCAGGRARARANERNCGERNAAAVFRNRAEHAIYIIPIVLNIRGIITVDLLGSVPKASLDL